MVRTLVDGKIPAAVRLAAFFVTLFFLSSCITVVLEPSLGSSQKPSISTSPQIASDSDQDEDARE